MRGRDKGRRPRGRAALPGGYVTLDVETTGLRKNDRVVEVAGELLDDHFTTVGRYATLINPGRPSGRAAQKIHGISDEMLSTAPRFEDVAGSVADLFRDRVAVAHHLPFDWGHLRNELLRVGVDAPVTVPGICTAMLARASGAPSARLEAVCTQLGIRHAVPHMAAADALATARVLHALQGHLPRLPSYRPCPPFGGVWRLPSSVAAQPRPDTRLAEQITHDTSSPSGAST